MKGKGECIEWNDCMHRQGRCSAIIKEKNRARVGGHKLKLWTVPSIGGIVLALLFWHCRTQAESCPKLSGANLKMPPLAKQYNLSLKKNGSWN